MSFTRCIPLVGRQKDHLAVAIGFAKDQSYLTCCKMDNEGDKSWSEITSRTESLSFCLVMEWRSSRKESQANKQTVSHEEGMEMAEPLHMGPKSMISVFIS